MALVVTQDYAGLPQAINCAVRVHGVNRGADIMRFWLAAIFLLAAAPGHGQIALVFKPQGGDARQNSFARETITRAIAGVTDEAVLLNPKDHAPTARTITLELDTAGAPASQVDPASEAFEIEFDQAGAAVIRAQASRGLIWGIRDFEHYYLRGWLEKPEGLHGKKFATSPKLNLRGFWTWQHGCYEPMGYIDRASEWKLNTVCFWNRGVPMNAERLANYAHERGVDIMWGFGWAWTWPDLTDASPALAERLMNIYEEQKKRVDTHLGTLCPSQPETPEAIRDLVLDVYGHQYAKLPGKKAIYFQTATESVCKCSACAARPVGETMLHAVIPAIEALTRAYPDLQISWGIHNSKDPKEYAALKQLPANINICWEQGVYWASSIDDFKRQAAWRAPHENVYGIIRMTMNGGLIFRAENVGGEKDYVWPNRIDQMWAYLEEGKPASLGSGYRQFELNGKAIGHPCTSDWSPKEGRLLDNANVKDTLDWTRAMADSQAANKGVMLLVEAGLIDLKMRRAPAMAAEILWDPALERSELESRMAAIWNESVGGWQASVSPYWTQAMNTTGPDAPAQDITGGHGLGATYDKMK